MKIMVKYVVVKLLKMTGFVIVVNVEKMMGSQAQVLVVKMMDFKVGSRL